MIYGNFPWEKDGSDPKTLFSWKPPEFDFFQYVFPFGQTFKNVEYPSTDAIITTLFQELQTSEISFEPHYFSELQNSPYFFCFTVEVSPCLVPTFLHDLTFTQMLNVSPKKTLRTSKITFAFQTKLPYWNFFMGFVLWIFSAEMFSRIQLFNELQQFFEEGTLPNEENTDLWPYVNRDVDFSSLHYLPLPIPGKESTLSLSFPISLSWVCPMYKEPFHALAFECLRFMIKSLDPKIFVLLFSAFCLERSMIIYSRDTSITTHIVQCFLFLVRPMKVVSRIICLLPLKFSDFLQSPTPYLFGYVNPIDNVDEYQVFLDLDKKKCKIGKQCPPHSRLNTFYEVISQIWSEKRVEKILEASHSLIRDFIEPIPTSIVSDLSDPLHPRSRFLQEAYLCNFKREDRKFADAFSTTQMFQFQVEQICLQKTTENKKHYTGTD
jgi:hypothetical protein